MAITEGGSAGRGSVCLPSGVSAWGGVLGAVSAWGVCLPDGGESAQRGICLGGVHPPVDRQTPVKTTVAYCKHNILLMHYPVIYYLSDTF